MKLFAEIRHFPGQGYEMVIGDARIKRNFNTPHGEVFFISTPYYPSEERLLQFVIKQLRSESYYAMANEYLKNDATYHRERHHEVDSKLREAEREIKKLKEKLENPRKEGPTQPPEVLDRHDIDREITDDMGTMSH